MRIVWNSFHGRYSDNPRALYESLAGRADLEHLWLQDLDHAAAFPTETITVDINGPDARRILESADLLVANTHTEVEWRKSDRTTYLQTWHGTPLKRIHRDVLWAPEGRLDRLDRDIAKWDLLLSPNAVSTPRLRQAFRYGGEVLQSGYPRNDLLSSSAAQVLRAKVRAALGVPDEATVVLYAPTWRDDEALADEHQDIPLALDLEVFRRELGEDHVLLVRTHNMVTGRTAIAITPGAHDVSYYPDVRDLYAAADVLVTDYSSAMFDFAITGRPMVFYAYDLVRFETSIRGFYFDFIPEAPGPVVHTSEQVVEAIRRLPDLTETYGEAYGRFRACYTALEDGRATQRVLERLGL